MSYLKIKNNGLIDVKAFTLIGASTKLGNENTIGQFGSGNKYAIAYLLRNNLEFKVFSGSKEIIFTKKQDEFRNQSFEVVHINGKETSMTTQMGFDWKLWYAMRELICNAMDEDGFEITDNVEIDTNADETHIYIKQTYELREFMLDFDNYFALNKKTLYKTEYGAILRSHGTPYVNVYRKGIRCYDSNVKALFDYDFKSIDINESRVAKYNWQVEDTVRKIIVTLTDKAMINKIIRNCKDSDYIESICPDGSMAEFSKEWKEVLRGITICDKSVSGWLTESEILTTTFLNSGWFKMITESLSDEDFNTPESISTSKKGLTKKVAEVTPLHKNTLSKANDFLKECGFEQPYDIEVVEFDKPNTLGMADMEAKKILISTNALELGVHDSVNTILEEYAHIKFDCKDETRKMQTCLINMLVTYMKEKNAYNI